MSVQATTAPRPIARGWKPGLQTILCTLVLLVVAFLVLYPLGLLLVNSFQLSRPGQPAVYGLDGWTLAFTQPGMRAAIGNTLTITAAQVTLSMLVSVFVAWAIARTDIFKRNWLELGFWIAYFLPALPVVLAWILLLDPQFGLVNSAVARLTGAEAGPFNIYSWWGIVWAHLITHAIAVKVMLLVPAFRNMDSALEEASLVAGASNLGTTLRVLLPIMTPTILVVVLMSVIRGLEAFEIELILGLPENIDVYSTKIYRLVHQEPAQYGPATAMGALILAVMVPLVFFQLWTTRRRRYTTITSRVRAGLIPLGPWRWPVFLSVVGIIVLLTIVPTIFLLMSTQLVEKRPRPRPRSIKL